MENKMTFGRSFRQMADLIKAGKSKFLTVMVMILIPILIINCYSFFVMYDGLSLNYAALDELPKDVNVFSAFSREQIESINKVLEDFLPQSDYRVRGYDYVLTVLEFLIRVVADILMIVIALRLLNKKNSEEGMGLAVLRRLLPVIILKLLADWFLSVTDGMIMQALMMSAIMLYSWGALGLAVMWTALLMTFLLAAFIICWGMLFIYYATLAVCLGRCRLIVALRYSRELLHGRVFKNMLHILPFAAAGFILPSVIKFFALDQMKNPVVGLIMIAAAVILQTVASLFLWLYLIKDFAELEDVSGIREKIRQIMENAMRQREAMMRKREEKQQEEQTPEEDQEEKTEEPAEPMNDEDKQQ